jgi:hypothetical protein
VQIVAEAELVSPPPKEKPVGDHARLHASLLDLEKYLGMLTGGPCPIVAEDEREHGRLPLYVGRAAAARLGAIERAPVAGQTLRVVVRKDAIAAYGDSELATSYAIYTLLDALGCRWYMPGRWGEVVPRNPLVELALGDQMAAPSTLYRGIWYADEDFKRRNRLGGEQLAAGHALETYVTAEQRAQHPEWRASINGKPHASRLEWHVPEVADAIAQGVERALEKHHAKSASLSPGDGIDLSTSPGDTALDSGDMIGALGRPSATDRFLVLANRVAERVAEQHPDVLLGALAYARTFRPPRREPVDPHIVPVIAPILSCRAHPLTDDACPTARALRDAIDGWSERVPKLGYYAYLYNLSETSAPNPLIRKLSAEIPYLLRHEVVFWMPETMPNFDTSLPGLWLSIRLPWDLRLEPAAVLEDLYRGFYGAAAAPARAYWEYMDSLWVDTPEHAGASRSYMRRFTPDRMARARELMDAALGAASTIAEHERIELADDSLRLFERFMGMQEDLWAGRLKRLEPSVARWKALVAGLAVLHASEFAFTGARWAGVETVSGRYFARFIEPTLDDAARIAHFRMLTTSPVRKLRVRFEVEPRDPCEAPELDDSAWRETDIATESWATLDHGEYFGGACYRARIALKAERAGESTYLWLGRYEGAIRVFADGAELVPVDADRKPMRTASARGPQSFALPRMKSARSVVIAVRVRRTELEELGGGGLEAPVVVYRVGKGKSMPSRSRSAG